MPDPLFALEEWSELFLFFCFWLRLTMCGGEEERKTDNRPNRFAHILSIFWSLIRHLRSISICRRSPELITLTFGRQICVATHKLISAAFIYIILYWILTNDGEIDFQISCRRIAKIHTTPVDAFVLDAYVIDFQLCGMGRAAEVGAWSECQFGRPQPRLSKLSTTHVKAVSNIENSLSFSRNTLHKSGHFLWSVFDIL